jgi:hypothetical protein
VEAAKVLELLSGTHASNYFSELIVNRTCKGKGAVNVTVKETVNIPKGVDNGINLRISKKGHY